MTDQEWSKAVKERYGYQCTYPRCYSTIVESCHIFSRWHTEVRINVENGIPMCRRHHSLFDSLSKSKRKSMAILLVGVKRYARLEAQIV